MEQLLSVLGELGFSEYESRAYVALLRRNPVNGYELARLSDVPRGNIYAVLKRLEDRGAVVRAEAEDGTRYAPVAPDELLASLAGRHRRTLDEARQLLGNAAAPQQAELVWNMDGREVMLEHARSLIESARGRLLLGVWPEEARALSGEVAECAERGVAVETLCLAGCPQECGACRGDIHRYRLQPREGSRWLIVVPDATEVLAGETGQDESTRAVRTQQRLLVDLTASYIRHSIALAAVLGAPGDDLAAHLSPEARKALEMLREAEDGGETAAWSARLGELLAGGDAPGTVVGGGKL